jgi:LysR family glycine cleavage system transcriptional activator
MQTIPPLGTLQAFEAIARRHSFAQAASDLGLTASAVSHQIAKLEKMVGTRLIDRTPAGVKLSSAGEQYLQRVSSAIAALASATRDLQGGVRHSLYVHVSPSLASLWLMPRLPDFAKAHPDVSFFLSASHVHSDFGAGLSDVDIRYGVPNWPNLVVEPLFKEQVMPLVSPVLQKRLKIKEPADVLQAPLIQSAVSVVQWSDWLASVGVNESPEPQSLRYALRFDRAQLSLDAAIQGLGVALESATMAAPHLEAGRLVPLFDTKKSIRVQGHFVVYPKRHAKRKEVATFLAWLRTQCAP